MYAKHLDSARFSSILSNLDKMSMKNCTNYALAREFAPHTEKKGAQTVHRSGKHNSNTLKNTPSLFFSRGRSVCLDDGDLSTVHAYKQKR